MADGDLDGLKFGLFGRAVYDSADREWHCNRALGRSFSFVRVGEPLVVFGGSTDPAIDATSLTSKDVSASHRAKQIKALVKSCPEIQPAYGLLPGLARTSEAIGRAASRHDPAKGQLLAISNVSDEATRRPSPVVAFASGRTGSDLRVAQIQYQRQGWNDSRSDGLEVPVVHGQQAVWHGPGAAIQAVTFAHSFYRGEAYLAIRMLTRIVIFRPVLRRTALSSGSRLDLNQTAELGSLEMGGSPPADVAFDPWQTRNVAVVDSVDSWSVWDLATTPARRIRQSPIRTDPGRADSPVVDDGWARITWVCDSTILAVCDRRALKLFDVSNFDASEMVGLDVGLLKGVGWILDLHLVTSRPRHICVLTSTHLLLFYINRGMHDQVDVRRLFSTRHSRNPEDISLRLRISLDGQDAIVFIRSGISPLTASFNLFFLSDTEVALGDPSEFDGTSNSIHSVSQHALDLQLTPVSYARKQQVVNRHSIASRYENKGIRFYVQISLDRTFSLRQCLYASVTSSNATPNFISPSWKKPLPLSATRVGGEGFIVENDETEAVASQSRVSEPRSTYMVRRKARAELNEADEWTLSFNLAVQQINNVDVSHVTALDEVLEEAQNLLANGDVNVITPFMTMRQLVEGETTVTDLQQTIRRLEVLQASQPVNANAERPLENDEADTEAPLCLALGKICLPPKLFPGFSQESERLSEFHDLLKTTFAQKSVHPPPELLQLSKDHMEWQVAAELTLASLAFRVESSEKRQKSQMASDSQDQIQQWTLPMRSGTVLSSHSGPSIYYDASSRPETPGLPTPSASVSGAQSTLTGSSYTSTSTAQELNRLSRYTAFSDTARPSTLPRRLNRVLAHWSPGADPSTYDWRSASRHVSQHEEAELGDEDMTERERRQAQRKAERHIRRQRREAEESQRLQMLSSQAPEIVSASQRGPSTSKAASQDVAAAMTARGGQAMGINQMPMSQVLPGRHGGRLGPRKKRKSGF